MEVIPTDLIALNAYSARANVGEERSVAEDLFRIDSDYFRRSSSSSRAGRSRRARAHAPTWYNRPSGEKTVMCRS
jgi:hypothetical protein